MIVLILMVANYSIFRAQSETLKLADELYENKNYESALTEYLRVKFQITSSSSNTNYLITLKISNCLEKLKNYERAIENYNQALSECSQDSMRQKIKLRIAINYLAHGNYSMAELNLLKLYNSSEGENKVVVQFYLFITSIRQYNWNKAREYLEKLQEIVVTNEDKLFLLDLHAIVLKAESHQQQSVGVDEVKKYSTIFPGLGQLYAGDHKNALNAFILNGSLIYLSIYTIVNANFIDAIGYLFLSYRYYNGNIERAGMIAEKINTDKQNEFYNEIVGYLNNIIL